MQNYKSLCAAVTICSTLVNNQTHAHTRDLRAFIHTQRQHFDQLIMKILDSLCIYITEVLERSISALALLYKLPDSSVIARVVSFLEISGNINKNLKIITPIIFYWNSLIFLEAVLKTSYF